MDNKSKLPDNVWDAARLLWENSMTITDRELVEQLKKHFGDDAPRSIGTISKRRKKEGWDKNNLNKARRTTPRKVPKVETEQAGDDGNRKQDRDNLVLLPSKNNRVQKRETDRSEETRNPILEEITKRVVIDANGRAELIFEHRDIWGVMRRISKNALELLLEITDNVDDPDFDPEVLQKKIVVVGVISQTLESLTKSQKIISEVEMPLSGIGADDFKQSEQERRLGALAELGDIDAEESVARDRLQIELHERLTEMEALASRADFGREDNDDYDNDDDDPIDDTDYTAVD
jgi:hypothetical protein